MKISAASVLALLTAAATTFASPIGPVAPGPTDDPTAGADPNLPPGLDLTKVFISSISYGGTGCPQGSVGISLALDRKTFTLIFDQYVASIGPKSKPEDRRKNCQINVGLQYPGGFQYSVFSSDYRGFIELDKGVSGTQKANYYFSGNTAQASTQATFNGPISKDYLIHDEVPFSSTVWSPCGSPQALNINSQIRLENGNSKTLAGYMSTDSIDGKVTYIVGVQWQKCVPTP